MSIRNLILAVNSVTVLYLIFMENYYKIRQILLQNATEVYDKTRQFYYKMRQLLQIATSLLQNATVITNCDSTKNNIFDSIKSFVKVSQQPFLGLLQN